MIRIEAKDLPVSASAALSQFQQEVDTQPTYEAQVAEGKRLFKLKRRTMAFGPVLSTLDAVCSGARRCWYCEDSQATAVEHIWPQDFYPSIVFAWENYLYACSRCNGPKSNICDIYLGSQDRHSSVPAYVQTHNRHPPLGSPRLINPRFEDPMTFMILDLRDTFFFFPLAAPGTREWDRANHTIQILKLNDEDILPAARKEAYDNYVARLEQYIERRKTNSEREMSLLVDALQRMCHPTVWHEMKRQAQMNIPHPHPSRLQEIKRLFSLVPNALTW